MQVHVRRARLHSIELRSIDLSARTYFLAFDICALGLVNMYHGKAHALYARILGSHDFYLDLCLYSLLDWRGQAHVDGIWWSFLLQAIQNDIFPRI